MPSQFMQVVRRACRKLFYKGFTVKKMMLTALGAAFLMFGASSSALADECDTSLLPNEKNWTYTLVEGEPTFGEWSTTPSGNVHVEVTTVTYCGATNKGGNLVDDHSYVLDSSGEPAKVLVCHKDHGLTVEGSALGFTDATCS